MKNSLILLLSLVVIGCTSIAKDINKPFTISIKNTPPISKCDGEYLIITFLENNNGDIKTIWAHSTSSTAGKYKVHYSKRLYRKSNNECSHIDMVLNHSEQFIEKEFYGGHSYELKENLFRTVVINKI